VFLQAEGLKSLVNPRTTVLMAKDYRLSITQGERTAPLDTGRYRAEVKLSDLEAYEGLKTAASVPGGEMMAPMVIQRMAVEIVSRMKAEER
jgi:hypothetical protein